MQNIDVSYIWGTLTQAYNNILKLKSMKYRKYIEIQFLPSQLVPLEGYSGGCVNRISHKHSCLVLGVAIGLLLNTLRVFLY